MPPKIPGKKTKFGTILAEKLVNDNVLTGINLS